MSENTETAISNLMNALVALYEQEDYPGGREAVAALRSVSVGDLALPPHNPMPDRLAHAWADDPIADIAPFTAANHLLNWQFSGMKDGQIREDIARNLMSCQIIGPDGMIHHPTVKVGLFFQSAGVDYVTRTHPAEETFIMLSGEGIWTCENVTQTAHAGAIIHHPSNAPHNSVTRARPLIAAWRWTGDIDFANYTLIG